MFFYNLLLLPRTNSVFWIMVAFVMTREHFAVQQSSVLGQSYRPTADFKHLTSIFIIHCISSGDK